MLYSPPSLLPPFPPPPLPSSGVKVLVVGTLTVEDGLSVESPEFLGLPDLFLQHYHVPLLDHSATLTFLNARNIHKYIRKTVPSIDTA